MKIRDCNCVRLIRDRKKYADEGVHAGDIGVVLGEERNGYLLVGFDGEVINVDGIEVGLENEVAVLVEDVELVWTHEDGWLKK